MRERRVAEDAAAVELLADEALRVVRRRVAQRACGRVEALDDHAPAARPAPAAAGELRDERERALLRSEVGEPQCRVGVEDHGERDVGEVVPLRHHLRADEHAARRLLEAAQEVEDRAAAAGGVEPPEQGRHRAAVPG